MFVDILLQLACDPGAPHEFETLKKGGNKDESIKRFSKFTS